MTLNNEKVKILENLLEEMKEDMEKEKKDWKERRIYQGEYGKGWIESRRYVRRKWINKIKKLIEEHK